MFQHGQLAVPQGELSILPDVLDLLGSQAKVEAVSTEFFRTIHRWMPIISKKRFYGTLLPNFSQRRADTALLFLCMDLVSRPPSGTSKNPKCRLYLAAKRLHLDAEMAGVFTVQVLQAGILIALYELGHAIYPSAYLSVGACARYAIALGLNGSVMSQMTRPLTWIEVEERQRTWWAIIIMDRCVHITASEVGRHPADLYVRFVNLSMPSRTLATEDPHPDDLLPADDAAWDEGVTQITTHSRDVLLTETTCRLFLQLVCTPSPPQPILRLGGMAAWCKQFTSSGASINISPTVFRTWHSTTKRQSSFTALFVR